MKIPLDMQDFQGKYPPTIPRPSLIDAIRTVLGRSRVVAFPRRVSAEFVQTDSLNYFDLEDPLSLARLEVPMIALRDRAGLVVIDS